jgi:hypothetical protein
MDPSLRNIIVMLEVVSLNVWKIQHAASIKRDRLFTNLIKRPRSLICSAPVGCDTLLRKLTASFSDIILVPRGFFTLTFGDFVNFFQDFCVLVMATLELASCFVSVGLLALLSSVLFPRMS